MTDFLAFIITAFLALVMAFAFAPPAKDRPCQITTMPTGQFHCAGQP